MKRLEFYEIYCRLKQPDGSFTKPIVKDFDRWLFNELDKGKTLQIVKGRSTKIILV
jgi:hypothetical protein